MKKICILLVLALLLSVSSSAWAEEEDTWIEVISIDGVSVIVFGDELMMSDEAGFNADEASGAAAAGFALPKFLTAIGERAFEGISAKEVVVSENVKSIGPYAFANCENLRTVTISESVKKIEEHAFANCKSLQTINIPAAVTEIDNTAFDGCKDVKVYGTSGTRAEEIAKLYASSGFTFIDESEDPEEILDPLPVLEIPKTPVLPRVPLN